MTDPLSTDQDEEMSLEDQQDSILEKIRKYRDRKTLGKEDKTVNHQTSQSCPELKSSEQKKTLEDKESTVPSDHFKGFNITLGEQNELVFTNTTNIFTYSSETNIPGNGPVTKVFNMREPETKVQVPMDDSDIDNEYLLNHKKRGYMVLFVNDQILDDTDHRKGADEDFRKMEEIRNKFEFELFNPGMTTNLSKSAMQMVLKRAQHIDHSECDCFAIMVSTHGVQLSSPRNNTGDIYGLLCADGEIMEIRELVKMFDDNHCPTLAGKPKLFFIQACRGEKMDDGSTIIVSGERRITENGNDLEEKPDTTDTNESLPKTTRFDSPSRTTGYESPSRTTRQESPSTTARYESPSTTASYESPSRTTRYESTSRTARYESPSRTTKYESPSRTTKYESPSRTTRNESPSRTVRYESPSRTKRYETTSRTARYICPPSINFATLSDDDTQYLNCCENDMLVLFAAPPGMVAWRSEHLGSWMIHHLHEVLMEYNFKRPKNLVNVLTKACRLISQRETQVKDPELDKKTVVSVIESKLTKDILFQ